MAAATADIGLGWTDECGSFREPAGWMLAELPENKEAGEAVARHVRAAKAGDVAGKRTSRDARQC